MGGTVIVARLVAAYLVTHSSSRRSAAAGPVDLAYRSGMAVVGFVDDYIRCPPARNRSG